MPSIIIKGIGYSGTVFEEAVPDDLEDLDVKSLVMRDFYNVFRCCSSVAFN